MTQPIAYSQLRDRVRTILIRDLKLGPDTVLDEQTPLFHHGADYDSLDLLLVVSSLERELGVRVANDAVGEQTFRTLGTLTAYVQAHQSSGQPVAASAPPTDPLQRLPHGPPFRFVDQVTAVRPDDSAEGVWTVRGDEPFFAGHFPGRPIVPGVLLAEALAQLAGLVATPTEPGAVALLGQVDVRFTRPVVPPATVVLHAKLTRKLVALQQFDVEARVDQVVVARGTVALAHGAGA